MQWQNHDSKTKNTGAQKPAISLDDFMNELGNYMQNSTSTKSSQNTNIPLINNFNANYNNTHSHTFNYGHFNNNGPNPNNSYFNGIANSMPNYNQNGNNIFPNAPNNFNTNLDSNSNYFYNFNNAQHNQNSNNESASKNIDRLNNVFFNMSDNTFKSNNNSHMNGFVNNQTNSFNNADFNSSNNNNFQANKLALPTQEDEFEEVIEDDNQANNNTNINYKITNTNNNYTNNDKNNENSKNINANLINNNGNSPNKNNQKTSITNKLADFNVDDIFDKEDLKKINNNYDDEFQEVEEDENHSPNKYEIENTDINNNINKMDKKIDLNQVDNNTRNTNYDNQNKTNQNELFDDLDFEEVQEEQNNNTNNTVNANSNNLFGEFAGNNNMIKQETQIYSQANETAFYNAPPKINLVSNLEMALKNKDKLVNFNPDDFLNNFQKESIVSNPIEDKAKGENGDDEFYFCEEEENNSNRESNNYNQHRNSISNLDKNILNKKEFLKVENNIIDSSKLSSFEKILNKIFHKESDQLAFFENLTRLLISFSEELQKHGKSLSDLKAFFSKENLEISKEMFENSRKLSNFFNGIIRLLMLLSRIESLNLKIKENLNAFDDKLIAKIKDNLNSNSDLLHELNKLKSEIFNYFKFFEKCGILNFSKLIEFESLKNLEIKELFEINLEEIEKNRCQLCLHELDCDLKTQLFSGDFHIICINYWINVIDNNSPFNN